LLLRDLGLDVARVILSRLEDDGTILARAVFHARCGLVEDLAYGIRTLQARYLERAQARFSETFRDGPTLRPAASS